MVQKLFKNQPRNTIFIVENKMVRVLIRKCESGNVKTILNNAGISALFSIWYQHHGVYRFS